MKSGELYVVAADNWYCWDYIHSDEPTKPLRLELGECYLCISCISANVKQHVSANSLFRNIDFVIIYVPRLSDFCLITRDYASNNSVLANLLVHNDR